MPSNMSNNHYLEIAPTNGPGRWERTGETTCETTARAQMVNILAAWRRWGETNRQIRLVRLDWIESHDMPVTTVVETHST